LARSGYAGGMDVGVIIIFAAAAVIVVFALARGLHRNR
jgi:hypothetical protein